MRKSIKKIIALVSVFSLVFGFSVFPSNAESSSEYVSVKTFEKEMNEIYSKYDSSFQVVDDNGVEYISKEYAEKMYQEAEIALMQNQLENEENVLDFTSTPPKRVMPTSYHQRDTFIVRGKSGFAGFAHECQGTVNAQYNSFMNLTYSGVYRSGSALNYDDFTISDFTQSYSNGNRTFTVQFNIDVVFSWTEPNTNMRYSESVRNFYSVPFTAN